MCFGILRVNFAGTEIISTDNAESAKYPATKPSPLVTT